MTQLRKKIMLVEDEALIAMHEKLVLERFGYDVVLALSGEKAIAAFNADPSIDLVLMDIDLGKGIDGTETARSLLQTRDVPHFIMICRDITEQVRIDDDLQESKRHAESLLNVSAEIIMATDRDGVITLLNDNGHRLFGYEPGELIGRKWAEVGLVGEARTEVVSFLDDLLQRGNDTLVAHENLVRLKSGELRSILWHNTVLRDRNGVPTGILSSGEDISEYKELEERYRTIIEVSPDIIAVTDLQGRMVMCSPKAVAMFGYDSLDDALGRSVTDFMVPEDTPKALGNLQRMAAGEARGVEEYRGLRKDGSTFDIEINGEFIRDADGNPEEILFVIRDTSAKKRLQSNYKLLFDLSPVGIGLWADPGLGTRTADAGDAPDGAGQRYQSGAGFQVLARRATLLV